MAAAALSDFLSLKVRSVLLLLAIVAASSLTLAYADKGYDPKWGVGMENEIMALATAPDGSLMVTTLFAENVTTVRAFSGTGLLTWQSELDGDYPSVAVSATRVVLASESPLPRLVVLSARDGSNLTVFNLSSAPSAVAIDGPDVYVATQSSSGLNVEGRPTVSRVQDERLLPVLELSDLASTLDAKNGTVAAGTRDSKIAIRTAQGTVFYMDVKRPPVSTALSATGRYLAVGCLQTGQDDRPLGSGTDGTPQRNLGNIYLFDLLQANPSVPFWNNESEDGIGWVGISANGERVAALGERPSSFVIHYLGRDQGGSPLWTHDADAVVARDAVTISPDGTRVTYATLTGDIRILKGDEGKDVGTYKASGGTIVKSVSPDGFAAVTRQTPRAAYSILSAWSYEGEPVILTSGVAIPIVATFELAAGAAVIVFLVRRMD
ncbi:MAG: hypothetical protein HY556_06155 [Euryarchaeota archaeon]|nr:hypothetical protein [Euryarchaeota archaeon]